jgi:hypothetical protein
MSDAPLELADVDELPQCSVCHAPLPELRGGLVCVVGTCAARGLDAELVRQHGLPSAPRTVTR